MFFHSNILFLIVGIVVWQSFSASAYVFFSSFQISKSLFDYTFISYASICSFYYWSLSQFIQVIYITIIHYFILTSLLHKVYTLTPTTSRWPVPPTLSTLHGILLLLDPMHLVLYSDTLSNHRGSILIPRS